MTNEAALEFDLLLKEYGQLCYNEGFTTARCNSTEDRNLVMVLTDDIFIIKAHKSLIKEQIKKHLGGISV